MLRGIILFGLLIYAALFAFIWVRQRSLIYHPAANGPETPRDFGVDFQRIELVSADGAKISAWWIKHSDNTTGRPTVLYCHGNAGTLSRLSEVSSIFYNLGWNALLFDYREYGDSSTGTLGLSEAGLVSDAKAAYDWLIANSIPSNKIIVWGHSLGSGVAAELAAPLPVAGLVLEGTFPSVYRMSRFIYPWFPIFPFMLWDKYETEKRVIERKFPLLVMHSEKDTVIPLSLGREVFEIAAEPKEWLLVKDVGHADFPSVHTKYDQQLKDFAARALEKAKR